VPFETDSSTFITLRVKHSSMLSRREISSVHTVAEYSTSVLITLIYLRLGLPCGLFHSGILPAILKPGLFNNFVLNFGVSDKRL